MLSVRYRSVNFSGDGSRAVPPQVRGDRPGYEPLLFFLQKSMSLKYGPASEPLHIYVNPKRKTRTQVAGQKSDQAFHILGRAGRE